MSMNKGSPHVRERIPRVREYDSPHVHEQIPHVREYESPHVHELVLVDVSVLVEVECLDELARTCLVEPGHLHDRPEQLIDRQEPVSTAVQIVEELHCLLLSAISPTSQNSV